MNEQTIYNYLSFSGKMLFPGFSIYMFELIYDNNNCFYYVGMTGDNYYPSARSAIHRLSGHFERAKTSTQNQIKIKLDNTKELDLNKLEVKMHHWSIEGFEPLRASLANFKIDSLNTKEKSKYDEYKKMQSEILSLEKALIYFLNKKKVNVINKTKGIKNDEILGAYPQITNKINKIIKRGHNE